MSFRVCFLALWQGNEYLGVSLLPSVQRYCPGPGVDPLSFGRVFYPKVKMFAWLLRKEGVYLAGPGLRLRTFLSLGSVPSRMAGGVDLVGTREW